MIKKRLVKCFLLAPLGVAIMWLAYASLVGFRVDDSSIRREMRQKALLEYFSKTDMFVGKESEFVRGPHVVENSYFIESDDGSVFRVWIIRLEYDGEIQLPLAFSGWMGVNHDGFYSVFIKTLNNKIIGKSRVFVFAQAKFSIDDNEIFIYRIGDRYQYYYAFFKQIY